MISPHRKARTVSNARTEPGGEVIAFPVTGQVVLFICEDSARAQMAAAFFSSKVGARARVRCASESEVVEPTAAELAAMAAVGIDLGRQRAEPLSPDLVRAVHHVVVLGSGTRFDRPPGTRARVERWPLDEPSDRGIHGMSRLTLIRDGIENNVDTLVGHLGLDASWEV